MMRRKPRSGPLGDTARSSSAGPPRPTTGPTHRPTARADERTRRGAPDGLWVYGRHAVLAAVANPHRPVSRLLATAETVSDLTRAAADAPAPRPAPLCVDRREIAAVLPAEAVHQGFAALVRPLEPVDLDAALERAPEEAAGGPLVVMLDQVTDPRNVGAVLRSAHAFGAAAVIVQDRHAPPETGALAKAASGALEAVPLVREVNLARALRALGERGFQRVGLDGAATETLARERLGGPVVLVLGAEGDGLRRLVRESCDRLVRIPIAPGVDSLNLSAAAAIALHEAARARATAPAVEAPAGGAPAGGDPPAAGAAGEGGRRP